MSNVPDWLLIITGLGGGVIGSLITTYGTQAKERRVARVELLAVLARADKIVGQESSTNRDLGDAAREVVTAALLAGIPIYIADTYLLAYQAVRSKDLAWGPGQTVPQDPATVGLHTYREAVRLMQLAIWRPLLSRLIRKRRSQRIRRFLTAVLPPDAVIQVGRDAGTRKWERAAIRAAKARNNGDSAVPPRGA